MTFLEQLKHQQMDNKSLVCVGLDSSLAKLPVHLSKDSEGLWEFNKAIVDATFDLVSTYKPNLAFYEADDTLEVLKKTVDYIHQKGLPVIADAKRGDIGSTSAAYAKALFERFKFDAATVNPYLGLDGIAPFLEYKDKGVIILARTSNPGAKDFQDLDCDGKPLYQKVVEKILLWHKQYGNCLMVVGATYPEEMKIIRQMAPEITFLVPGIGKQGGTVEEAVKAGINQEGLGMIINSAREIIYAANSEDFAQAARAKTQVLKEEINKYRKI